MADVFEAWGEMRKEQICSLSDKKIFLLGKKGGDSSFLQRCRLRTEQILQGEAAASQKEICRLQMERTEAGAAKEAAEEDLRQCSQEEGDLRAYKKEVRLKKKAEIAARRIRQAELELEQLQIETKRRQDTWEMLYQEIAAIYRQGAGRTEEGNQIETENGDEI